MVHALKKAILQSPQIYVLIRSFILIVLIGSNFSALSQVQFIGNVVESNNHNPLPYVNIGIKKKNIGTASLGDGSFFISIPEEHIGDTLTFSLVGYHELDVPINSLN